MHKIRLRYFCNDPGSHLASYNSININLSIAVFDCFQLLLSCQLFYFCILTDSGPHTLASHTKSKIKTQDEIEALSDTRLVLVSKWGCSSGQSEYKQKISEDNSSNLTDNNMFITSMVPLRLQCSVTDSCGKILVLRPPTFVGLLSFNT